MADNYILVGSFKYAPERGEYIGVVCKQEGKTLTVLTLGAEETEFAILEWIKNTVQIMRESGKFDVQAPDMYDRAVVSLKH